jgi:TRAP-type C4-dicarboxylate transport system permease large subunit
MVQQAGIDLIWFGIYLVIVVEMSAITPPVGFNLFVIQALAGNDLLQVSKAAIPFFLLLVAGVVVLFMFPQLATYLPELMTRR